ncbi:MAG TPA: hypothetical protein VNJ52_10675 [Patescibacteria group bacterium]|nr:hypothetical protein [Patescibacteria group bacterium]
MPTGINAGNYNVQGSLTFGWRYSNITGSQANYDTFVNLQQGPRLLDFSFNARSLNHNGALFDNMSVAGFGFGGDPVDVVRLNMTKNKWYDFNATYRRYKYFWNYNLLANPLNPSSSVPAVPITTSPHLMDLSHRMTDLQLRLFPQSAVHLRLGYTHSLEVGPSFTTDGAATAPIDELGATALLYQNFKTTEDNYDIGIDFDFLPRTTLSYDEFVEHYKEDTSAMDGNLNYVLPDGTPVDLGLVFSPGTPCATPVTDPNTTPPTATGGVCQGNILATHDVRPRATIPTERFAFQTTYFRNLNMTGQFSYSSGSQTIDNPLNYNTWIGVNTRYDGLGSNDTATTKAKRIIVNGNWNTVYDVTAKFRVMDSFDYNNFRIPGIDNFNVINYFAPVGGFSLAGAAALAQNPSQYLFNPATCPAPYTADACPQHDSTSAGADAATGYQRSYLAQDFRSNTFELIYDFTPKVGGHVGYRYTKRIITDINTQLFYTAEIFYPGGTVGAARGDCASGCAPGPNGSLVFTGLASGSDAYNQAANIDGNSALFGLWVRPARNFRTSFNLELFSADQSFTRITPRLLRHYQINSTYTPVAWANITGTIDIVDSSNDVTEVQNKNHDRSYSISTTFMPASRFSFDLSYNYNDIYTQALACYTVGFGPLPTGAAACPFAASPVPVAAITTYSSKTDYAGADMMVKPIKQLTFTFGYSGSFVRSTPSWFNPLSSYSVPFLDPLTPYGPLRYNYQQPYVRMNWDVYRGLSYTASWNYYGYNSRGNDNPVGLAPLGTEDFNGNNMTMSARYAF